MAILPVRVLAGAAFSRLLISQTESFDFIVLDFSRFFCLNLVYTFISLFCDILRYGI